MDKQFDPVAFWLPHLMDAIALRSHAEKTMRRSKLNGPTWDCMWYARAYLGDRAACALDALGGMAAAW